MATITLEQRQIIAQLLIDSGSIGRRWFMDTSFIFSLSLEQKLGNGHLFFISSSGLESCWSHFMASSTVPLTCRFRNHVHWSTWTSLNIKDTSMLFTYLNVVAATTINIEKKWSMQCVKYHTLYCERLSLRLCSKTFWYEIM